MGHALHVTSNVAPETDPNVPNGHAVHAFSIVDPPESILNLPAGHSKQAFEEEDSFAAEYFPGPHSLHSVLSELEYVPA